MGTTLFLKRLIIQLVVRFFMMQAHYGGTLDFSGEALEAAEKGFNRLIAGYKLMDSLAGSSSSSTDVGSLIDSFYHAMGDDFNTPVLISHLFEAVKFINSVNDGNASITADDLEKLKKEMKGFVEDVLGLQEPGNRKRI